MSVCYHFICSCPSELGGSAAEGPHQGLNHKGICSQRGKRTLNCEHGVCEDHPRVRGLSKATLCYLRQLLEDLGAMTSSLCKGDTFFSFLSYTSGLKQLHLSHKKVDLKSYWTNTQQGSSRQDAQWVLGSLNFRLCLFSGGEHLEKVQHHPGQWECGWAPAGEVLH